MKIARAGIALGRKEGLAESGEGRNEPLPTRLLLDLIMPKSKQLRYCLGTDGACLITFCRAARCNEEKEQHPWVPPSFLLGIGAIRSSWPP